MSKTKKRIGIVSTILLIAVLAGCKDNVYVEPEVGADMKTEIPTTLTMIQEQVFDVSCALAGCHAGSFPAAGMNLSAESSYSNLVNVTSKRNSNFKRVDPGNSANSFIIKMLRNTGENTLQMPPSGKLSDGTIQLVESWIDDGAKNN